MIIDKVENSFLYEGLGENLALALKYIRETDFLNIPEGNYKLKGEEVFAIVQEYATKEEKEGRLESHRKYIDVQYIIEGVEKMGLVTLRNQEPTEIIEKNDVLFYDKDVSTLVEFSAGMFGVFFPDDLHKPGIRSGASVKVRKVVVKILKP